MKINSNKLTLKLEYNCVKKRNKLVARLAKSVDGTSTLSLFYSKTGSRKIVKEAKMIPSQDVVSRVLEVIFY